MSWSEIKKKREQETSTPLSKAVNNVAGGLWKQVGQSIIQSNKERQARQKKEEEEKKKREELLKTKVNIPSTYQRNTPSATQMLLNNPNVKIASQEETKNLKNPNSLWEKIKTLAGDTGRFFSNVGLGADSGIKNTGNYMYASAESNRQKTMGTQVQDEINKIGNSKDLTDEEKNSYLALYGKRSARTNKIPTNTENSLVSNIDLSNAKNILAKNPLDDTIAGNNQKIAENIEKQSNPVTKKLAELAPSVGNMGVGMVASAINPYLGGTYFTLSSAGSYMDDAKARGMTEEQSIKYGAIMGALEGITEEIGVRNIQKAGATVKALASGAGKEGAKEAVSQISKEEIKKSLKNYGIGIADNFAQESIMEPLQELNAKLIGGEDKANFENMEQRMLQAGIDGALTSIIMSGAEAGANIGEGYAISKANKCQKLIEKIQNGEQITQTEIKEAVNEAEKLGVDIQKETKDSMQYWMNKAQTIIDQEANNQATNQNVEQKQTIDNKVVKQETKTAQNGLSQEQNSLLKKVDAIKDNISEDDYNQLRDMVNNNEYESAEYFNDFVKQVNQMSIEQNYKSSDFRTDQDRKRAYAQYQRQNNTNGIKYNNDIVNNALNTVKANRNGRRTVGQWKQVASQIGLEASDLSKADIDNIAYGSWFDLEPSKNITKYDNRTKERKGFERLTSDEWINAIYESAKKQKIQDLDTALNQSIESSQAQNENRNMDISNKVEEYLNKTGLSSKINVEEFIKKAENFTLENEENMTEQQKELYDIIKDIQNRNAVNEETVDYDNGLWYNDEGIEFSNKFYEEQLDSAITTDTPNLKKNKLYTKEFGDNFYLFEKTSDGIYAKYLQLKIEGNEDIINSLEEAVKNGELTNIQKIHESIDEYWNRDTDSDGINSSNEKQTRENGQSSEFYREKSKSNIRSNSEKSNANSNVQDSQGRSLTKGQQEYFKNSQVRDEKGNLKTLYHGTDADFTVFDYKYLGKNGTSLGKGFYLTDDPSTAKGYADRGSGKVMEVYANIEKPLAYGKTTMSVEEYIKFIEAINKETDGQFLGDYRDGDKIKRDNPQYEELLDEFREEYTYGGDDIDLISGVLNSANLSLEKSYKILKETTGYDGIISEKGFLTDEGTVYVPFLSEQIKSVENINPTDNPDILKEEYQQLTIEGFNNEPENNLSKENWNKYQESKKKTNEVLKKEGTKVEVEKRKFSKDFIDNGYIDLNGKIIKNAADIADVSQIFRNPKYETFRVIYMQGNKIVGQEAVSSKTPSETNIYTGASQAKGLYKIKNRMERLKADGYYLVHNHPTGVAKASNADIQTTNLLDNKVKGFLGHVIINSGTYALIEKNSNSEFKVIDEIKIQNYKADKVDKMLSKEPWANMQLKSRDDILNLAYDLKNNPNYASLILTDSRLKARIVLDIPNKFLNMTPRQINGYIRNVARQNGANHAFLATQDISTFQRADILNTLQDCILYSVDENGNLIAKKSRDKNHPGHSIFSSYNSITLRANEKIEDIYNSFFNTEEKEDLKLPMKEKQEVKLPMKEKIQQTQENAQNNNTPGETINWNEIERPESNQKFRKHYKSIIESSNTTAEAKAIAKELMGKDTYTPETNKGQLAQADQRIMTSSPETELQALRSRVLNGERITSVDIAVGERLIQYFSKTGSADQLQDAIQTTALAGTSTGQTLQAMTILNHQTPQGQVTWIQRSIDKMNKELARRKGGTITTDADGNLQVINKQGKDITNKVDLFNLTPEMINKIMNSENQEQMYKNIDEVYEELGQQVPKGFLEKIDSWRYFSMLANARTHIRNMVGNVAMGKMQRAKDKLAGGIEDVVSKFNPDMERTKTLRRADKKTKEFAKNDFKNTEVQSRLELNENKFIPQSRLQNARRTFKSDAMENTLGRLFNLNDKLLSAEDGIGLKAAYQKALADYITANKIDVDNITDAQLGKARNYAVQQAKEATFHQANAIASAVAQFENKNLATKLFTGAVLPFKKTPMNVAKAGMEYSPLQIAKSATLDLVNLRKGNISINQYIDNLSKGMTGTGVALVGYALANAGILKASGGDDKDKEKYDEEQGKQSYSIEIAGKTYSLDWLAPTGIPLFIGAETYKLFNQEDTEKSSEKSSEENRLNQAIKGATNLLNAGATAINPMSEMSMISGLTSALSSYNTSDNLGSLGNIMTNAGKSYINQFFPTLMGQVAKTGDEYERTTKSTATGTIGKAVDQTINQIKAKVPGLRQTLPIKTDIWGKDIKQEVNLPLRALNNFINPATVKEVSTDKVDKELNKLYEENKNSALLPDILTKTVQLNGQTYRLNNKEYAEFTKNYGQTSHKLIEDFIKTSDYGRLTQEQKETAISDIYSYAKEQNKLKYAEKVDEDVKPSTLYTTMEAIKKNGGKQSEYLNYLAKTKGMSKEVEKNQILANSNYSNKTKEIIYTNGTGKDDNLYNNLLSKSSINMTEYLNYKNKVSNKEFAADKDSNGKTISGSAKTKVINYLNNNITGVGNRLLIAGNSYALTNSEKQKLTQYINQIATTKEARLEIYEQLDKNFTVKDGKVYMKVSSK